jgi:hypothetical protein
MQTKLMRKIARQGSNKEKIAAEVIQCPEALPALFEGLNSDQAPVRFGSEKILRCISMKQPGLLYPHFDFFVTLLDAGNSLEAPAHRCAKGLKHFSRSAARNF